MLKPGIGLICAVAVICAAIIGYKLSYPTYTYRYRLTVDIEDNGARRSASSVIEVKVETQPQVGSAPPQVSRVRGEAAFVEVGDRNIIAILAAGPNAVNVDYPISIVPTLFGISLSRNDLPILSRLEGSRGVPPERLPDFVTFSDLADLKSARIVAPAEFQNVLGKGIHLHKVTVTLTDDPVTDGIESKMPKIIRQLRERSRHMQVFAPGDPYSPQLGHFLAGE